MSCSESSKAKASVAAAGDEQKMLEVAQLWARRRAGDDRAQPARGRPKTPGKAGDSAVVPHLAGDSGRVFRLAGRPQAGARLSGSFCSSRRPKTTRKCPPPPPPWKMRNSARVAEAVYQMEIESLDLGAGTRAVGCELIDPETREPAGGREAAEIWAASLAALAAAESWSLDFFAHIDRVRDFCREQAIGFREPEPARAAGDPGAGKRKSSAGAVRGALLERPSAREPAGRLRRPTRRLRVGLPSGAWISTSPPIETIHSARCAISRAVF